MKNSELLSDTSCPIYEKGVDMEYRIARKDLLEWCRIPMEKLSGHPHRKCNIRISSDKTELFREIGNDMAEELKEHNDLGITTKWILPSGHLDQYSYFAERVNSEDIDTSKLHVFHMDDWLDWQFRSFDSSCTSFRSARSIMAKGFYGLLDEKHRIPEENQHWPDIRDLDGYDALIEDMGGVDTVQGGVGCRGMIAFNEPPRSGYYRVSLEEYRNSRTRPTMINDDTIVAYAQREFGGCYEAIPPAGITVGMKSILTAKKGIFLVTTGAWKQTVIRVALFSEPTVEFPVTLAANWLPEMTLYCDENTADHVMSHNADAGYLEGMYE